MSIRYCTTRLAPFAGTALGNEVSPAELNDLDLNHFISVPLCATLTPADQEKINAGDRLVWVPQGRKIELHWGEPQRCISSIRWDCGDQLRRGVGSGFDVRFYVWTPPRQYSGYILVLVVGEPMRAFWDIVWTDAAEKAMKNVPLWQPERERTRPTWQQAESQWAFNRGTDRVRAEREKRFRARWDAKLRYMDSVEAAIDGLPDVPDRIKRQAACEWDEHLDAWRNARRLEAARAFRGVGRQKIVADDVPLNPNSPNPRRGRTPRWLHRDRAMAKEPWRTMTRREREEMDEMIPF
jgi:hypothetical protein